jgi:hypothetical protein
MALGAIALKYDGAASGILRKYYLKEKYFIIPRPDEAQTQNSDCRPLW